MTHRIVVLGAGYAGTAAAGRIARRVHGDDVHITLVNTGPEFVERVRLHQLAAGQDLPPRPLARMLAGTGVELRQAAVTAVDADRKAVAVAGTHGDAGPDGTAEIGYDTLVYALGSGWDDHGVRGVAEHAYQVADRAGALGLRERIARLAAGQTVTVVGGGLTGIESATEIAESRPDVRVSIVVDGELGAWLSPNGRRHLRDVAARLGIAVHEHTTVTAVDAHAVETGGGRIGSDVTVWAAGFAVHPIAAASTLAVNDRGQIVVDGTMRSVSHPDVYAVGDAGFATGSTGAPLRMSCSSGVPMAWQAADAIAARLTGTRLPRVPLRYVSQCISLGRNDGLIQFVTADDRALGATLRGGTAARFKELICKGAAWATANPTLGVPTRRRRVAPARADGPASPALGAGARAS